MKRMLFLGLAFCCASIFLSEVYAQDDNNINQSSDSSLKLKREAEQGGDIENIRVLKVQNFQGSIILKKNEGVQILLPDGYEVMFVIRDIKENKMEIQVLPQKETEVLPLNTPRIFTVEDGKRQMVLILTGLTKDKGSINVILCALPNEEPDGAQAAQISDSSRIDKPGVVAQNNENLKIIFDAEFTGKTYVELYLDGVEKVKGVIQPGARQRWEASDLVQIKIGNAGNVKVRINGKDYTFGLPGQVANKVVTWKKDTANPNLYQLSICDWY